MWGSNHGCCLLPASAGGNRAPIIHWDGEQVRDYVYVGDVARANALALTGGDDRCYCIGTCVGTSVNQIYRMLSEIIGVEIALRRGPRRPGDLRAAYFDCSGARRELGSEPMVSLADGLERTVESFRHELGQPPTVGTGSGTLGRAS